VTLVWGRFRLSAEMEGLIHAYDGNCPQIHVAVSWLCPVLRRVMPNHVTTTDALRRAMIAVVGRRGSGEHILHSPEITRAARA
jgi:hypothetical protein